MGLMDYGLNMEVNLSLGEKSIQNIIKQINNLNIQLSQMVNKAYVEATGNMNKAVETAIEPHILHIDLDVSGAELEKELKKSQFQGNKLSDDVTRSFRRMANTLGDISFEEMLDPYAMDVALEKVAKIRAILDATHLIIPTEDIGKMEGAVARFHTRINEQFAKQNRQLRTMATEIGSMKPWEVPDKTLEQYQELLKTHKKLFEVKKKVGGLTEAEIADMTALNAVTEDIVRSTEKIKKIYEILGRMTKAIGLGGLKPFASAAGMAEWALDKLKNAFIAAIAREEQFHTTNYRFYGSMRNLSDQMRDTALSTGYLRTESEAAFKALMKAGAPRAALKDMAKSNLDMARASGMANSAVAELQVSLFQAYGNTRAAKGAMDALTSSMRQYGLTTEDATALSDVMKRNAGIIAMNKDDIEAATHAYARMMREGKKAGATTAEMISLIDRMASGEMSAIGGLAMFAENSFENIANRGKFATEVQIGMATRLTKIAQLSSIQQGENYARIAEVAKMSKSAFQGLSLSVFKAMNRTGILQKQLKNAEWVKGLKDGQITMEFLADHAKDLEKAMTGLTIEQEKAIQEAMATKLPSTFKEEAAAARVNLYRAWGEFMDRVMVFFEQIDLKAILSVFSGILKVIGSILSGITFITKKLGIVGTVLNAALAMAVVGFAVKFTKFIITIPGRLSGKISQGLSKGFGTLGDWLSKRGGRLGKIGAWISKAASGGAGGEAVPVRIVGGSSMTGTESIFEKIGPSPVTGKRVAEVEKKAVQELAKKEGTFLSRTMQSLRGGMEKLGQRFPRLGNFLSKFTGRLGSLFSKMGGWFGKLGSSFGRLLTRIPFLGKVFGKFGSMAANVAGKILPSLGGGLGRIAGLASKVVGPALGFLGPAVAVAGAAFAGWEVGKWLGKVTGASEWVFEKGKSFFKWWRGEDEAAKKAAENRKAILAKQGVTEAQAKSAAQASNVMEALRAGNVAAAKKLAATAHMTVAQAKDIVKKDATYSKYYADVLSGKATEAAKAAKAAAESKKKTTGTLFAAMTYEEKWAGVPENLRPKIPGIAATTPMLAAPKVPVPAETVVATPTPGPTPPPESPTNPVVEVLKSIDDKVDLRALPQIAQILSKSLLDRAPSGRGLAVESNQWHQAR